MPLPAAIKSIKQPFQPAPELLQLMETFRHATNDAIRIGLEYNKTSLKSLSNAAYYDLKRHDIVSQYRLCAISKAAGILSNYRKLISSGSQEPGSEGKAGVQQTIIAPL